MKRATRYLAAVVPLLLTSFAQGKDLPNVNAYHGAKPIAAPGVTGALTATASPPRRSPRPR